MLDKVTVVTHTDSTSGRDISRCLQSVSEALPIGGEHLIIDLSVTRQTFDQARYAAMSLGSAIVFVDDDDYVDKNSLLYCLHALNETGAGLAFTREVIVDENQQEKRTDKIPTYEDLCKHPQSIHHMTMYRASLITHRAKYLIEKYNCLSEWVLKAEAAFSHHGEGAIHVPIDGYYWVQHKKQSCKETNRQNAVRLVTPELSFLFLINWMTRLGQIPVWAI